MSNVAAPSKNRRIDRRRQPKDSVKATCRKGTLDLGLNLAVGVLDVSETAARLTLRCPLPTKQEVAITLEGPNHTRPIRRVGTVMWCVEAAAEGYCVGIHFDKRLPYIDVIKLS